MHSLAHKPTTNGQVERTIGTIAGRLFRWLKENEGRAHDWRRVFQDTIRNYNRTVHSATGMTPHDALVNATDETRGAVVRQREAALERTMRRERRKFKEIRAGDQVRISMKREDPVTRAKAKIHQLKGHNADGNWTADTFTVERVNARSRHAVFPTYRLRGSPSVYKREELQRG